MIVRTYNVKFITIKIYFPFLQRNSLSFDVKLSANFFIFRSALFFVLIPAKIRESYGTFFKYSINIVNFSVSEKDRERERETEKEIMKERKKYAYKSFIL